MIESGKLKGKVYKCDTCGSTLFYDPESKKLKCRHCSALKDLSKVYDAFELAYSNSTETSFEPWGDTKSAKCRSCGAEFVLNEYETSAKCPYCGVSNVMYIDDIPGLKPNAILPFAISEDQAKEIFEKWLKSKKLAPNLLRKNARKQDVSGVYLPLFTFDSETESYYQIKYGVHYTVTVGQGEKAHTEVRTKWYTVNGYYSDFFNDVQVEASRYIREKDMRKMGYFDTTNALRYDSQFITGYAAERYSTSLDESWDIARSIIDSSIEHSILAKYNYDELEYCRVNTSYLNRKYKYILAPIWIIDYRFKTKEYRCIINGRNGKAIGKAPVSPTKVSFIVIAGLIALAAIGIIIYLNLVH